MSLFDRLAEYGHECWKCGYRWKSMLKNPKACPRCKVRLDYKRKRK